ncbi:hypothetical protein AGLY_008320 [Aphis glycines]|uniref:Uncharacterized protein n=1 Tax=Aphis glycines TaxID=307491 RepID=A0A6G0TLP4_APHGL|nr:hypothetical protein AGLY_008320 [Aphis glycines]
MVNVMHYRSIIVCDRSNINCKLVDMYKKSHIVITCQFSIRDISKLWFFVIHVSCKKKLNSCVYEPLDFSRGINFYQLKMKNPKHLEFDYITSQSETISKSDMNRSFHQHASDDLKMLINWFENKHKNIIYNSTKTIVRSKEQKEKKVQVTETFKVHSFIVVELNILRVDHETLMIMHAVYYHVSNPPVVDCGLREMYTLCNRPLFIIIDNSFVHQIRESIKCYKPSSQ